MSTFEFVIAEFFIIGFPLQVYLLLKCFEQELIRMDVNRQSVPGIACLERPTNWLRISAETQAQIDSIRQLQKKFVHVRNAVVVVAAIPVYFWISSFSI